MRVNRTGVVVPENVHIVQSDALTDQDVHPGNAAHPKKDAIANDQEKEADATMKVEALIVMDAQEAVIVMHLAQVQLATAATTTTANGKCGNDFSIKPKPNKFNCLIYIFATDQIVQETNHRIIQAIQVNHQNEGKATLHTSTETKFLNFCKQATDQSFSYFHLQLLR